MLISLCFRIITLSLAARIIPMIRRASAGWDAAEEERDGGEYWEGKTLGEEAPVSPACSTGGVCGMGLIRKVTVLERTVDDDLVVVSQGDLDCRVYALVTYVSLVNSTRHTPIPQSSDIVFLFIPSARQRISSMVAVRALSLSQPPGSHASADVSCAG